MQERHHIYNFHIGFWNAFLITLVVMFQSALFLFVGSGISLAATAVAETLTITRPTNTVPEAHFNQSQKVDFTTTSSVLFSQVIFEVYAIDQIVNPTSEILVMGNIMGQFVGTDSSIGSWTPEPTDIGFYKITAQLQGGQGNTIFADPVFISVGEQPLVVTLFAPSDNSVAGIDLLISANAEPSADSLVFELVPIGATIPLSPSIQASPTTSVTWTPLVPPDWSDQVAFPPGDYELFAKATRVVNGQTEIVESTPRITITVPTNTTVTQTITMKLPTGTSSLLADPVDLKATTDYDANKIFFEISDSSTPPSFTALTVEGVGVVGNGQKTWTATLNIDSLPNSVAGTPYLITATEFLADGTENTAIPKAFVFVEKDFPVPADTTVAPLEITTASLLPNMTKNTAVQITLDATGGPVDIANNQVYVWSYVGNPVAGLGIDTVTGLISGSPTTPGSTTFRVQVAVGTITTIKTFNVTVDDIPNEPAPPADTTTPPADNTNPPADTTTNPPLAITEEVPTTISLSVSPIDGVGNVKGNNVNIIVTSDGEAISQPSLLLVKAGRDVWSRASSPPSSSVDGKVWTYIMNSHNYANGSYEVRAHSNTVAQSTYVNAGSLSITIANPAEEESTGPVYQGGSIISPREGSGFSGKVPITVEVLGDIIAVEFRVDDSSSTPTNPITRVDKIVGTNKWQGVWNSDGVGAGTMKVFVRVTDKNGDVHLLPKVTFQLTSVTTAINTPEPELAEVVAPEILSNITKDGLLDDTPVECQIVNIIDKAECDKYLRTRNIKLLDEADQKKARADLTDFVTRHIEVGGGTAVKVDSAPDNSADPQLTPSKKKVVEDPLSGIIPLNKEKNKNTKVLVVTSTEPPDSLKPFVEQTVPAVLVFDQDGDGLSDESEKRFGTNPNNPDTDGDGFSDGMEVKNGYNPNGAGALTKAVSPLDQAILNNRPLDQPKFAGALDKEGLKVDGATALPKSDQDTEEGEGIHFAGQAEPFSFITLYIYSSLPIVISVEADASGNWEYDLSHPLVDGKHDVYATVTNDTGKILKKSSPLSFFVQSASAMTEQEFLQSTENIQDNSGTFMLYYMLGGLLIVLLGGGMFFYYIRQQKSYS